MIFTPDQIKRLPGSKVLLADGRTGHIAALIADCVWCVEFQMRGGRMALANRSKYSVPSPIYIVEVLQWSDEKQPETTDTLEQLHDHHARMVEQLAQEIYKQHVAKMKKSARLGIK